MQIICNNASDKHLNPDNRIPKHVTTIAITTPDLHAPVPTALPPTWKSDHPVILRYNPLVSQMLAMTSQFPYSAMPEGVVAYRNLLELVGQSIVNPFWQQDQHCYYVPDPGDEHFETKSKLLSALTGLAELMPSIPGLVWHALAYISARANPFEEDSLLLATEEHFVMGNATDNDTALHATALVTSFMGFIQNVLEATLGVNIVHGCKCGCCIIAVDPSTCRLMPERPSDEQIENWSIAVFSHLITEGVKTKILDLPFQLKF